MIYREKPRTLPLLPLLGALFSAPLACAAPRVGSGDLREPTEVVTNVIDSAVARGEEVGFSYLVVRAAGPGFEVTRGRRDAAEPGEVGPETMFLSASMTKVVTAMAVLRLVDQGKVRLDDPLSRHLPDHPYGEKVTIRSLLNHSAGVPNPLPLKWVHGSQEHDEFDGSSALARVLARHDRLSAEPGEEYGYTNVGYWLLGAVIERVSRMPFPEFVRAELCDPLGMSEDEFTFRIPPSARLARGHYRRYSLLGLLVPFLTESKIRLRGVGPWGRFAPVTMDGAAYGGAFATARGYGKLLSDLLREHSRVLSDTSRQALLSSEYSSTGRPLGVTLAFREGELDGARYLSKPGGGPGVSGNLRLYPDRGFATVFLSNTMRVSESAIQEVSDALDRALLAGR